MNSAAWEGAARRRKGDAGREVRSDDGGLASLVVRQCPTAVRRQFFRVESKLGSSRWKPEYQADKQHCTDTED